MKLLSGKELSERMLEKLKGSKAKLSVIQVGDNAVSKTYIDRKREAAEDIGVYFELVEFPEDIEQEKLIRSIKEVAENTDGLIVQLPLPKNLVQDEVLKAIPTEKDVDVLSADSFESFSDDSFPVLPPTVCAISELFLEYGIDIKEKNIVVVGSGRLVGKPIAVWLKNKGVNVNVLDSKTEDLASEVKKADIVITGVGKPNLITGDMVKEGVVVIDAGTSVEDGETSGDIDFDSVSKKASMISPVPGGVGPLTVSCLLRNLVILKER